MQKFVSQKFELKMYPKLANKMYMFRPNTQLDLLHNRSPVT